MFPASIYGKAKIVADAKSVALIPEPNRGIGFKTARQLGQKVRSLVLVSGFSHGSDPRLNLQFKLWLRLASTDKVGFTKLLLVSGLSPGFFSAFDEPTLNGIIEKLYRVD
jgi:hypothetical protein